MRYLITENPTENLVIANDDDLSFEASMVHFARKIEIKICKIINLGIFGM